MPVGEVSNRATPDVNGPSGIPSWHRPVPRAVLARSPLAYVVLRPTALDARLSIAGHGDARVEPLGRWSSWFFDGQAWQNERLAGIAAPAQGTYRIWLMVGLGDPPAA